MWWWNVFIQKVLIYFSRLMPRICHLHISKCLGFSSSPVEEQGGEEEEGEERGGRGGKGEWEKVPESMCYEG